VDQLALQFTLTGSHPDWTRIGTMHVCPSRANNVDQALKSNRDTKDQFARICATEKTRIDERLHDIAIEQEDVRSRIDELERRLNELEASAIDAEGNRKRGS
jgi:polyhydroxyalkanoate synthesis regulator phasin